MTAVYPATQAAIPDQEWRPVRSLMAEADRLLWAIEEVNKAAAPKRPPRAKGLSCEWAQHVVISPELAARVTRFLIKAELPVAYPWRAQEALDCLYEAQEVLMALRRFGRGDETRVETGGGEEGDG